MLAGKRVHKEFILAMVTAVLLVGLTARTVRAEGTCTAGTCYNVQFVNYFSNAAGPSNGKGYLRVTDPLELNTSGASTIQPEEICAMIYVFDIREGLQECCGCPVTSDGLLTLSYGNPNGDINTNPRSTTGQFFYAVGSSALFDGVVRILSTTTNATTTPISNNNNILQTGTDSPNGPGIYCDQFSGACCNPAATTLTLVTTLRAWIDHIQNDAVTNTEFEENPTHLD